MAPRLPLCCHLLLSPPTVTSYCHLLLSPPTVLTCSAHFTPHTLTSWLLLKYTKHCYFSVAILALPSPWASFPPDICVPWSFTSPRSWPKHCLVGDLITLHKTATYLPNISHSLCSDSSLWPLWSVSTVTSEIFIFRDFYVLLTSISSVLRTILAHR